MKTLIIRSLEDSTNTASILEKKGMKTEILPIFSVSYDNLQADEFLKIDPKTINAIIITSLKSVIALENASKELKNLQIFSVGDKTTKKLKEAGFNKIKTGPGTALELEETIQRFYKNKSDLSLSYVCGDKTSYDFTKLNSNENYKLTKYVVYKTTYIDALPNNIINDLKTGEIKKVVILSQNVGEKFVELVHKAGLSETCSSIKAYTLTKAIKETLEQVPFSSIQVPNKPKLDLIIKSITKRKSYKVKIISILILIIILAIAGTIGYYKILPDDKNLVSKTINYIIPQEIFPKSITNTIRNLVHKNTSKKTDQDKNTDTDNILTQDQDQTTTNPPVTNTDTSIINEDNTNSSNTDENSQVDENSTDESDNSTIQLTATNDETDTTTSTTTDDTSTTTDDTDTSEIPSDTATAQSPTNYSDEITSLEAKNNSLESEIGDLKNKLQNLSETKNQHVDDYVSYTLWLMVRQDVLAGRNSKNNLTLLKKSMGDISSDQNITTALYNLSKVNAESPQLPKLGASIFDLAYNGLMDYKYKAPGFMNYIEHYFYKIVKVKHKVYQSHSAESILEEIRINCLNNNYQNIEHLFSLLPTEVKASLHDWHAQALIAIGNLKDLDLLQNSLSQKLNFNN